MIAKQLTLALVLAAVSLTGQAQTEDKKALIAKVLKLQQSNIEQFGSMLVQQPVQQMMQQAGIALQNRVPADKRESVGKAINEEANKLMKELAPVLRASAVKNASGTLGPALEAKFSVAELKEIAKYLESPTIRSFVQINAEQQQALASKVAGETRATVDPKLRAFDQKLVQLLGLQPEAASAPKP